MADQERDYFSSDDRLIEVADRMPPTHQHCGGANSDSKHQTTKHSNYANILFAGRQVFFDLIKIVCVQ